MKQKKKKNQEQKKKKDWGVPKFKISRAVLLPRSFLFMTITLSPNPNRDRNPSLSPNLEHGARICSPGRPAKGVARSSRLRKQLSGKHERNPEIFLCVMESPGGEATVFILEIALCPLLSSCQDTFSLPANSLSATCS